MYVFVLEIFLCVLLEKYEKYFMDIPLIWRYIRYMNIHMIYEYSELIWPHHKYL